MDSLINNKSVSMNLLEPAITISVVFICLYIIISTENPAYHVIRSFLLKTKMFFYEIKDIFININYFALIFSSFFLVSYYVLNVLNYKNIKRLFCVNYDYYNNILNINLKELSFEAIFKNSISENYIVNFLYSFKFFFHIFFLNDVNILETLCIFVFVYVILSLYAKYVDRVSYVSNVLLNSILSGFVLVYFLKYFLKKNYNHCGEDIFSFLFLPFFYITNPYLSAYQYNDRSLHGYHGTELRFYVAVLYFIKFILYSGDFYELKVLVAILIYFILFLRQIIANFEASTFVKVVWIAAYYFVNGYLPFAFSKGLKFYKIFDTNVMFMLRNEFKSNLSLYQFNTFSKMPLNYLSSKTSFFWIPYILFNRSNKGLKCVIVILMIIDLIVTCALLATNFFPGIALNLLLIYCLDKIKI
ncbi:conserved membrane protein, unknown function [Hepatocystis sp. ex Piliocolobus tephrosceles]|nr:conserved membrane protein, unknown function [Hepatocystis sp. ex Piliocolobus tephrosceles]